VRWVEREKGKEGPGERERRTKKNYPFPASKFTTTVIQKTLLFHAHEVRKKFPETSESTLN